MINVIALFFALTISTSTFGYEVPKALRALLKNQSEQTYVGSEGENTSCEIKVFENKQGFQIEAYERDHNGNIDRIGNFGRFILNDSYELYDFWEDAFGIEAVSDYYSSFGSIYDEKAILKIEDYNNREKFVDITFKKNNGFFMYTHYHFECFMKL